MNTALSTSTRIKRGLLKRCPACGDAPLFHAYLKVTPTCPQCGEDNGRHRVDDAASYFTVLLVGHLILAPVLLIEAFWLMPLWQSLAIIFPLMIGITLLWLPFIKGGVLGALSAFAKDGGR
ncbi:DUF983 domain-containing protein [Sphingobium boeckii]|uniref:Uncharacterized protein (DUF983 family) n=1 Tax=Sphingobium boeckii TaxID=1082345 RepID=A0A7W9AJS6_9SPHN|nr:DUF983 domain-containing protein [Sphingobium boeckii]MBB5686980.1 uncharacterized protein (DUF983 family) [Sphingobium boeckii]